MGAYLDGSLNGLDTEEGSDEIAENGEYAVATSYVDMMTDENDTIRNMVIGYVMKDFYVGTIYTNETLTYEYTIYTFRQLVIMEMYSWANYTLGADIELPYSYGNAVTAGEFAYATAADVSSGEFDAPTIDPNGNTIYSSASGTFVGVEEVVR